jgi:WD40 repeat protein
VSNDAFISYSHRADRELAAATEKGLERLAKPLFAMRAMEVFRDVSDLPASSGLGPALEAQLEASRWLVFFASRASAQSTYCNDEITWWLAHRGTAQLLLVLTDGRIVWDRVPRDFNWQATDALPATLKGAFAAEPLYVDLREVRASGDLSLANPTFRAAILDLAAPIRGVPKNSLDSEDVRRQRQVRRLARGAVATIVLLGVAAAVLAVVARQQAQLSLARQLSAQARQVVRAQPDLGMLLAVEALNIVDTVQGRSALLDVLLDRPHLRRVLHGATQAELEQQEAFRFVGPTRPPSKQPVAPNGQPVWCDGGVETTSRSTDGRLAAYGCYAGDVRIADASGLWSGSSRIGHDQPVMSVLFADGDRLLASGGYDGRILLWHAASGVAMEPAFAENELPVLALGLSANGKTLVSLHEGGPAKLWDLTIRPRLKQPLGGSDSPDDALEFLPRSDLRSMVIHWKPGDAQRLATAFEGAGATDRFIALRANGQPAFASEFGLAADATVHHFDRDLGILVAPMVDSSGNKSRLRVRGDASGLDVQFETPGYVGAVAVSPDGQRLVGAIDRTVRIWELPSGTLVAGPVELESAPQVLRFDRKGTWLVAGLADGRLQPLDPRSATPLKAPLDAHLSTAMFGVHVLAVSPDGRMLASGGADGQIMLWDTSSWQRRASLPAHGVALRAGPIFEGRLAVTALAFSPDGSSLAANTIEGLALWFLGDQAWSRRPLEARGVGDLVFTAEGLGLVTAGGDGLLRWDLNPESWKRKACEIAGRNLTQAEWREYLTFSSERGMSWLRHFDPPYRATCP